MGGGQSFEDCISLESISFPSTLTVLGSWAFSGCEKLVSVKIPSNLTEVGNGAFYECVGLKSVVYASVAPIEWSTFEGCVSLEAVSLGNQVARIDSEAFKDCVKLSSITIPEVTEVANSAFEGCEMLSVIYGVKGSSAETFARNHGILFKELKTMSKVNVSKISNKAYTGKAITPSVTLKDGSKKLKNGTDYTISYKSNKKIGRAMITFTGKGEYIGERVEYFNIVPSKTTVKKVQSKKKGQLTVTVNKSKGAKGYVVAYSTKKSGGFKKIYTTKAKTTIKGLKSGKKYYVKVTPYTVILSQKQSPAYSSVKSKKVK